MDQPKYGDVVKFKMLGATISALVIMSQVAPDGVHLTLAYLDPNSGATVMSGSQVANSIKVKAGVLPLTDDQKSGWFVPDISDEVKSPTLRQGGFKVAETRDGQTGFYPGEQAFKAQPSNLSDEQKEQIKDGNPLFVRTFKDGTHAIGTPDQLPKQSEDGAEEEHTFEHPESSAAHGGVFSRIADAPSQQAAEAVNEAMTRSQRTPNQGLTPTTNSETPLVTDVGFDKALKTADAQAKLDASSDEVKEAQNEVQSAEQTEQEKAQGTDGELHGEERGSTYEVGTPTNQIFSGDGTTSGDTQPDAGQDENGNEPRQE